MKIKVLLATVLCGVASAASAETSLPPIVSDGLAAYQKADGKTALSTWLKGSPVENEGSTKAQVVALLAQIEAAYGKMNGYELIRVVELTPSTCRVYLVMKYEKGPLYASFDCYKAQGGWIIPTCDFNTKANSVLPPGILAGSTK